MRLNEAVFLIQSRLGGAEGLDERCRVELTLAQAKVEQMHPKPWFLLKTVDNLEIDDRGYSFLPDDFLFEYEDPRGQGSFWLKSEDGLTATQLIRGDYSYLFANRIEGDEPTQYDILGDKAYFFPAPPATRELLFIYYARDTELTTENIESAVLRYYPDLVIGLAGMAMATYEGEPDAYQAFSVEGAAAQERLTRDTVARQEVNRQARNVSE